MVYNKYFLAGYVVFYLIFDTDKNVVQVYINKNVRLFRQNLVNIALKIVNALINLKNIT